MADCFDVSEGRQALPVGHVAHLPGDGTVVPDVVTEVGRRRVVDGRRPHHVYPQVVQAVEALHEARDVPQAVAVVETPGEHLVDDRLLPPDPVDIVTRGHGRPGRVTLPHDGQAGGQSHERVGGGLVAALELQQTGRR